MRIQNTSVTMLMMSPAVAKPLEEYLSRCATPMALRMSPTSGTMPKNAPDQSETMETMNPAMPRPLTGFFSVTICAPQ